MSEEKKVPSLEEVVRGVVRPGHEKAFAEQQQYLKDLAERNRAKFTKEEKK